jgi:L-ascorbate metabolism protein UlaG (beta-lactamase superfamily)
MPEGSVRLTWLGHASFKLRSPKGKIVYVDPWLGNPKCPESEKQVDQADLVLVTHGHFDHLGDSAQISAQTGAQVVCNFEISVYLGGQGVQNAVGMNKGGTFEHDGIKITMVAADHSSGIMGENNAIIDGGSSGGFVIRFEDGYAVYHAGDTNVFGDMKLIGELYSPDLALLPIGGHYTMGPTEAALAVKLLGVDKVIPMHFGTFPALAGTPAELRSALASHQAEVIELQPGGSY